MGLYLRKSVRVGPFRFNLSGSGIGVSCGIRGLRIGTGPRGNYIYAGRGGIYYRAAIPPVARRGHQPEEPQRTQPVDSTLGEFRNVDTGVSVDMQDVSSKSLLDELNEKRAKWRITPWLIGIVIATCGALYLAKSPAWSIGFVIAFSAVVIVITSIRDTVKKSSVLLYDLDSDALQAYADLTVAFDAAAKSNRIWHVRSAASVLDRKYHAGASSVLNTDDTRLTKVPPPGVKTNVQPLTIPMPGLTVYLFPDRALILDAIGFGAANYRELGVDLAKSTFITGDRTAPSDATILEYTWRYVNKKGGPDHRFTNNPQLPVIETRDLSIRSRSGLNAVLKFSSVSAAESLRNGMSVFIAAQGANLAGNSGDSSTAASIRPRNLDDSAPTKRHFGIPIVIAVFFVAAAAAAGVAVLLRDSWKPHVVQQQPRSPSVVPQQSVNIVPTPEPSPARELVRAASPIPAVSATNTVASDPGFVRLTAPVSIRTPKGRVTLQKGLRLPLTAVKAESVTVHYFDGRDYPIPISATDHK
jgi:hypothetical protein